MPRFLAFVVSSPVLAALISYPGCGITPSSGDGPALKSYTNSGCLPGTSTGEDQPPGKLVQQQDGIANCGDDEFEFTVDGTVLQIVHRNATYNCCVDDIVVALSVEGTTLTLNEEEDLTSGGCFCTCCYDVEATVTDLQPGDYGVEFCWQDSETDSELCHMEDIVVP